MNIQASKKRKGFTLIEMLLVIVIIAMSIYIFMAYIQQNTLRQKIDRTAEQMQQILSAAVSYYVMNNAWPMNLGCLKASPSTSACSIVYIPPNMISPWGSAYEALQAPALNSNTSAGTVFYVWVEVQSQKVSGSAGRIAEVIAGKLPLSYVSGNAANEPPTPSACGPNATSCYVVAAVNIPVTNLNNAPAVSFSGLYRHGGCVPVPQCSVYVTNGVSMIPQVFVVPVSVSGLAKGASSATDVSVGSFSHETQEQQNELGGNNNDVYPIESFSAYATGGTNLTPPNCSQTSESPSGGSCPSNGSPTNKYWRVCMQIYTENGVVNTTNAANKWGDEVTLMAFTRCAIGNEPSGSAFTVFQ